MFRLLAFSATCEVLTPRDRRCRRCGLRAGRHPGGLTVEPENHVLEELLERRPELLLELVFRSANDQIEQPAMLLVHVVVTELPRVSGIADLLIAEEPRRQV